ncbi:MAG: hypothetical protein AB4062_19470 [Crocosphaera sp.]
MKNKEKQLKEKLALSWNLLVRKYPECEPNDFESDVGFYLQGGYLWLTSLDSSKIQDVINFANYEKGYPEDWIQSDAVPVP